jgi:AraC family transcriptional regulator
VHHASPSRRDRKLAIDSANSLVLREATLAEGIRLVHKRYPAGLRMGRHAHAEWRFCLVLAGSYTDSWRRGYRTRTPRHLSVHPAGEAHTSVFHSLATCFHIELTHPWRERLLGDGGIAPEPQEFLGGRVALIAAQMYQEFRERDLCSPLIVEGLTCELIGWSARESRRDRHRDPERHRGDGDGGDGARADAATRGASWLHDARDLLHDRFNESLTLQEIAGTLDVHPVHLARQFKRRFGTSVGAYVRRLRIAFVCRELSTTATLADLALRAGFADQGHLTRVFKQLTGCTPSQYRAGLR